MGLGISGSKGLLGFNSLRVCLGFRGIGFKSRVSIRALGLGLSIWALVLGRGHKVRCWVVRRAGQVLKA